MKGVGILLYINFIIILPITLCIWNEYTHEKWFSFRSTFRWIELSILLSSNIGIITVCYMKRDRLAFPQRKHRIVHFLLKKFKSEFADSLTDLYEIETKDLMDFKSLSWNRFIGPFGVIYGIDFVYKVFNC